MADSMFPIKTGAAPRLTPLEIADALNELHVEMRAFSKVTRILDRRLAAMEPEPDPATWPVPPERISTPLGDLCRLAKTGDATHYEITLRVTLSGHAESEMNTGSEMGDAMRSALQNMVTLAYIEFAGVARNPETR